MDQPHSDICYVFSISEEIIWIHRVTFLVYDFHKLILQHVIFVYFSETKI